MYKISSSNKRHTIIPVSLVIILLISIFLFAGSSPNSVNNLKPSRISARDSSDTGGGDIGGNWNPTCLNVQKWNEIRVDLLRKKFLDSNGNPIAWDDWTLANTYGLDSYNDAQWQLYSKVHGKLCDNEYNPPLKINDCKSIDLTVALLIDRSSSVIDSKAQDDYKASMSSLIRDFYTKVVENHGGKLNFLIYAFASKSVLQNDNTGSTGVPTITGNNVIMSASNDAEKQKILDVIDHIHFRSDNNPSYQDKTKDIVGFQYGTGFDGGGAKDKARAYNAGTSSLKYPYGMYGQTNWQDGFISLMQAQTELKSISRRIDLAVMVTDGDPSMDNGSDMVFNSDVKFKGVDDNRYSDGVDRSNGNAVSSWNNKYGNGQADLYKITTVSSGRANSLINMNSIRSGKDVPLPTGDITPFPIRGILISKDLRFGKEKDDLIKRDNAGDAAAHKELYRSYQLKDTMRDSFGETKAEKPNDPIDHYYYFSQTFGAELAGQLSQMVTDIFNDGPCNLNGTITPGISLKDDNGNTSGQAEIYEGDYTSINLKIKNNTTLASGTGNTTLTGIVVCASMVNTASQDGITDYDRCDAVKKWERPDLDSGSIDGPLSDIIKVQYPSDGKDYYMKYVVMAKTKADPKVIGSGSLVSATYTFHVFPRPNAFPA